jgi:hypothetical protein
LEDVFARPEYTWRIQRGPLDWLRDLWYRLLDWIGGVQTAHPAGFKVLLVVLIVALLGLLVHIAYVVWRITHPTAGTPRTVAAAPGLRLEDAHAHRHRAHELARAGRFAEAVAHEFVALLLDLERRKAVSFHPSKTPAEYVGEARLDAPGRESLADLVGRLYRHLFGALPCDERAYREFAAAAALVSRHVAAA